MHSFCVTPNRARQTVSAGIDHSGVPLAPCLSLRSPTKPPIVSVGCSCLTPTPYTLPCALPQHVQQGEDPRTSQRCPPWLLPGRQMARQDPRTLSSSQPAIGPCAFALHGSMAGARFMLVAVQFWFLVLILPARMMAAWCCAICGRLPSSGGAHGRPAAPA